MKKLGKSKKFEVSSTFKNYLTKKVAHALTFLDLKDRIAERVAERRQKDKERQKMQVERLRRIKKSLPHAKIILDWVCALQKTAEWKCYVKLGKMMGWSRREMVLELISCELAGQTIYILAKNGVRWYRWGPGSRERFCHSAELLADCANAKLLESLSYYIVSGRIWTYLEAYLVPLKKGGSLQDLV